MSESIRGRHDMGLTLETLMRDLKERGLQCSDLPQKTLLHITLDGGQVIDLEVHNPTTGLVLVGAVGAWTISVHLTESWGCTLFPKGLSFRLHWLMVGERLVLNTLMTPPITSIEIILPPEPESRR